jgi:hypothetical protein
MGISGQVDRKSMGRNMLTFDPEKHQYFFDGKPVPSVSEILRITGQAKDWKYTPEFYRQRGEVAHKCIELFVKGELDEDSVDEVVRPYLNQFKEWLTLEKGAGILLSEKPFYSKQLVYAGTCDLIANQVIYDIKCCKKLDDAALSQYSGQGSAYRTLIKENMDKDFPFKILLLTGTGSAKIVPVYAPYALWEHILGIYNIRMGRDV